MAPMGLLTLGLIHSSNQSFFKTVRMSNKIQTMTVERDDLVK